MISLQMYNQRKLGANLFSILSADKLETVFNGIFASANSIHIEQRMQRGRQMEGGPTMKKSNNGILKRKISLGCIRFEGEGY